MKQLQELIKETLVTEDGQNPSFPKFPYIVGKLRITQISFKLKLMEQIAKEVGGDYFTDRGFEEKFGHLHPFRSSKDNGKTFLDQKILNPNKFVEQMRASHNSTYAARIDTNKCIIAVDEFKTKEQTYRCTFYFKYIKE